MSKPDILELIRNAPVKWKTIREIGEIIRGNGLQKKDFVESGFPAIHYGQIYTQYGLSATDSFTFVSEALAGRLRKAQKNDLLLATTSETDEDVVKPLAWLGGEVAISGDMMLLRHNEDVKYLAYYFQSERFQFEKRKYITGAKVRRVSKSSLEKIEIPIPSPAVQQEIVRILDTMTALTSELTSEYNARQKQYQYYRDKLLTFNENEVEFKHLEDIGSVRMCKRILKNQTSSQGDIPFYKIGTFGKNPDAFISRELFEEYKIKYHYPKKGVVLISASGTIGRAIVFNGEPSYFQDSNIVWLENDEKQVLNKFLFYFYQIAKWGISDGGVIRRLYNENLRRVPIQIPSLETQARIVSILDKFDTLTTSISVGLPREIELRQKQYEYYRDLLLSFPKPEQKERAT